MDCCSGSNFTTAPDAEIAPSQRVNYSFGMVLGVDDFKQEHAWLAGRDERALREVIGYGVVAGLDVTLQPGADAGSVEIRVSPGLAVCPDGKVVAVTSAQCARLDTWLAGTGLQNPIVSGARTAYVVLAYAEKSGTPVPIPGEPCRDESALQSDSRIADGFRLELRWAPPSSEEDDALREFVAWLRQIEVQDHPSAGVSIPQFQDAIEQSLGVFLSGPFSPPTSPPGAWDAPPRSLVIPRDEYTAYISAAFDVWVRKLRPLHLAKFGPVQWVEGKGASEPAILLTRVVFELSAQGLLLSSGSPPALAHANGLARPQLLHLRLLQEWLLSNVENDAPREAFYVLDRADPRLPNAQNLYETFFGEDHVDLTRHGPMARVDAISGDQARVVPAEIWSGSHSENPDGDYYGPHMSAPILVTDGGTGQNSLPDEGQILVGAGQNFTIASVLGKTDTSDAGENASASASVGLNIVVEHAPSHDIVLDTIQAIHPQAEPTFAGLTLTGTTNTLLATNESGTVIPATEWEGGQTGFPFYYAPGQEAAVRIEDGGTGLQTLPGPLQILVGKTSTEDSESAEGEYVLATLQGGANVSVSLVESSSEDESEKFRTSEWAVQIDFEMPSPITPSQGGTGLTSAPNSGDILLGSSEGTFALAQVVGGGSISVTATEKSLTVDTSQPLSIGATPTFVDVILTAPPPSKAGAKFLGLDNDSKHIVVMDDIPIPDPSSNRRSIRVVPDGEHFVALGDDVLVATADVSFALPAPAKAFDGRVVTFKHLEKLSTKTTGLRIVGNIEGQEEASVLPGRSLTVIASAKLEQWLIIGRS